MQSHQTKPSIQRPFVVNFVCSPRDEFPDHGTYQQCFNNQRQIIVNADHPESALLAAEDILEKAYPYPYTITRIEDENCLRFGLALIEQSKAGKLPPAAATDDEEDWDRFAHLD